MSDILVFTLIDIITKELANADILMKFLPNERALISLLNDIVHSLAK